MLLLYKSKELINKYNSCFSDFTITSKEFNAQPWTFSSIPSWCDADVACSDFLIEHVGYSGILVCISSESLGRKHKRCSMTTINQNTLKSFEALRLLSRLGLISKSVTAYCCSLLVLKDAATCIPFEKLC